MIAGTQPLMTDHETAVLEVFIWFALIFFTSMAAYSFYRRFIREGDVIAEANQILDEQQSIESYIDDWSGVSTKAAIAETRSLDKDRS